MKLPVFKAFGATFALVFGHFVEFVKILWLPLALLVACAMWFAQHMTVFSNRMIELQQAGSHPDPHEVLQQLGPMMSWLGLLLLASIVFVPMIFAGVLRYVIRGERANLGVLYLNYGGDELRILVTLILQTLLFIAIYIAGAILIAILVGGVGMASRPAAAIAGLVGGIVLAIFMIWVCLRLSLTLPAAVGAKKIGIGPSWSVTKGNVWRLLGYWILWGILLVIIECVAINLLLPGYFQGLSSMFQDMAAHPGDPEAVRQASLQWQKHMMAIVSRRLPILIGLGFVFDLIIYPFLIASGGVAYRLMTEKKEGDIAPAI